MADTKTIARESFRIIETGDEELAQRIIAPNFINAEADDDPEDVDCRLRGPTASSTSLSSGAVPPVLLDQVCPRVAVALATVDLIAELLRLGRATARQYV
jgi:hypothetical protein